jgi:hypothetical protein
MKERPIIFNAEMVRALMDGRKTMTRRVLKVQPSGEQRPLSEWSSGLAAACHDHSPDQEKLAAHAKRLEGRIFPFTTDTGGLISPVCPYGQPGDRLYVKEACWIWGRWSRNGLTKTGRQRWRFTADSDHRVRFDKPDSTAKREAFDGVNIGNGGWVYRHARFMPRWASRILLEITNVRVDRVQDISEADAKAEGIRPWSAINGSATMGSRVVWGCGDISALDPVSAFELLWDSINSARGFGWEANPWVWVVSFRVLETAVRAA